MDDVELVRRLIGGADGGLIDNVIRVGEGSDQLGYLRRRELEDEIQVVRRARDAPGIAGHGPGEHVGDIGAVQTAKAILQ